MNHFIHKLQKKYLFITKELTLIEPVFDKSALLDEVCEFICYVIRKKFFKVKTCKRKERKSLELIQNGKLQILKKVFLLKKTKKGHLKIIFFLIKEYYPFFKNCTLSNWKFSNCSLDFNSRKMGNNETVYVLASCISMKDSCLFK